MTHFVERLQHTSFVESAIPTVNYATVRLIGVPRGATVGLKRLDINVSAQTNGTGTMKLFAIIVPVITPSTIDPPGTSTQALRPIWSCTLSQVLEIGSGGGERVFTTSPFVNEQRVLTDQRHGVKLRQQGAGFDVGWAFRYWLEAASSAARVSYSIIVDYDIGWDEETAIAPPLSIEELVAEEVQLLDA